MSRLAASDPSPWPAPCGQHIKGANTSCFVLCFFFVNNYYNGYSKAELGSREAAVSITRLAASSKAGVSLFLWRPEVQSSRGVREQGIH